jgi:hypothetical protein
MTRSRWRNRRISQTPGPEGAINPLCCLSEFRFKCRQKPLLLILIV